MSWTVVDDNGVCQVRASLTGIEEMNELINCLTKKVEKMAAKAPEITIKEIPNVDRNAV